MTRDHRHVEDDDHLAALGIKGELHRQFSPLAMLGLAFTILNSPTALVGSLSIALPSGGSISVVWGFLVAALCNLAIAASLAEFLSVWPSAGGQYHWVAIMSPPKWRPLLSYVTGYINVAGWIALIASGGLLGSTFVLGLVAISYPSFAVQKWQTFLIYSAFNLIAILVNIFGNHFLYIFNSFTMFWSITGFFVISIVALATASPDFNSGKTVFALWTNETGWPDGLAFLLGLLQGGFSITAYDSVAHMVEELPNAAKTGPRVMVQAVLIGLSTGFIFLVALLFSAGNLDQVTSSPYGPLAQILINATGSVAGTICLVVFPIVCMVNTTIAIQTTATRMTYAFARDKALPLSKLWARVDGKFHLPLNALFLVVTLITLFGLILIGSSSAFNAIISASVVALGLSYAMPITVSVLRGRRPLPKVRSFVMPEWLGWTCNIIGLIYTAITTVLFLFPPDRPVTPSNMNYAIVAFGIILIIAVLNWIFDGRKNFTGPVVEIDHHILTEASNGDSPKTEGNDQDAEGELKNE